MSSEDTFSSYRLPIPSEAVVISFMCSLTGVVSEPRAGQVSLSTYPLLLRVHLLLGPRPKLVPRKSLLEDLARQNDASDELEAPRVNRTRATSTRTSMQLGSKV